MNKILIYSCALAALLLASCATPVGSVKFPEASQGFSAKKTYPVAQESLWNAALSALEKNRVSIVSQDKGAGVIQTDYVEGTASLIAGGFGGGQSTRYKLNITTRRISDHESKLGIIAKVESTMRATNGKASPWTDVSGQNAKLIEQLENWLYQEIEKELPQGETK